MTIAQVLRQQASHDPDTVVDVVVNLSLLDADRLAALVAAGLPIPNRSRSLIKSPVASGQATCKR